MELWSFSTLSSPRGKHDLRVLVDATPLRRTGGGGLHTYVTRLLSSWRTVEPNDELIVAVSDQAAELVHASVRGAEIAILAAGSPANRLLTQYVTVPRLATDRGADVVFSVVPSLSPLLRTASVATVHDLRYATRPQEFPLHVRLYRQVAYHAAYHKATSLIAVSQATAKDLEHVCARTGTKTTVIHHGADHVDRWRRDASGDHALTFAHWSNKRPDLAIEAWAAIRQSRPRAALPLHIVGAQPDLRRHLMAMADGLGLERLIEVHGYLNDADFADLFARSRVVLLLSSYEGFGLPVVEAMRLRIPVVATMSPAILEVAGEAALICGGSPGEIAKSVISVIDDAAVRDSLIAKGSYRTAEMTWDDTARRTREVVRKAASL